MAIERTVDLGIVTAYAYAVSKGYEGTEAEFASLLANVAEDLSEIENLSVVVNTLPAGSSATASYNSGVLTLGIPRGDKGDEGDKGDTGDKGDKGDKGDTGDTGNGIESVVLTSTVGAVKTYTITFTDGSTTTFDVTDGEVTEVMLETAIDEKVEPLVNATLIERNANGSIASFADGADYPVKELIADINAVQSGSGDPSPSNVRPISGWSAVKVTVDGKNVLPKDNWVTGTIGIADNKFVLSASSTRKRMVDVPIKAGTYTVSGETATTVRAIIFYREDKSVITSWISSSTPKTFTISEDCFVAVASENMDDSTRKIQLELGSTATAYEPYNGTTETIDLGQTVYGGKLNVTTGELTIMRMIADLGTLTWSKKADGVFYTWELSNLIKPPKNNNLSGNLVCSALITGSYNDVYNNNVLDNAISASVESAIGVRMTAYTDATTFKSAMSGVQLVYDLATPISIQLTPTEVKSLLGQNNIFADSGDVDVTYRADTKKYIDGTIVDVPLAMIAPIETGTTASKAYAVGEYFILNGNQFCKAISAIASGATFTLNTNYTVTTIGAELKLLQ